MSDDKKNQGGLGLVPPGGVSSGIADATVAPAAKGKPVARLSLVIDFADPIEKADVAKIVADLKTKGAVTKAEFKVLRAHKQELI